jgi:hypothetical protein
MKKTAVFTSIAMLLSVVHSDFAAESPERLQELARASASAAESREQREQLDKLTREFNSASDTIIQSPEQLEEKDQLSSAAEASQSAQLEEQARIAREIYAQIPTPGRTVYQAEYLITPSYEGFKEKSILNDDLAIVRAAAIAGSIVLDSPKIVAATASTGPVGGVAATVTSPGVGAVIFEGTTSYFRYKKHNTFSKRAGKNPILTILEHRDDSTKPSVVKIEDEDDRKRCAYFDMATGTELPNATDYRPEPEHHLSKGGYVIVNKNGEGIPAPSGTIWQPTRKLHGKIYVTMGTPLPKDPKPQKRNTTKPEDFYEPGVIKIWRCSGICNEKHFGANKLSDDCQPNCADLIQTCKSPSYDVALRSFALSACGQRLAFGCTNGAVFILHRHDDLQTEGRPWIWYSDLEQRLGKPSTAHLNAIRKRLQEARSPRLDEIESKQNTLAILPPSS